MARASASSIGFSRCGLKSAPPKALRFMQAGTRLTEDLAARFARMALNCVAREYPNKIAHTMQSDADVLPPRVLTPAFYGCYDWHSAVHGHWLLPRLARMFPNAASTSKAAAAL